MLADVSVNMGLLFVDLQQHQRWCNYNVDTRRDLLERFYDTIRGHWVLIKSVHLSHFTLCFVYLGSCFIHRKVSPTFSHCHPLHMKKGSSQPYGLYTDGYGSY